MSAQCAHDGWGDYPGETGPCPPPTDLVSIPGGVECPTCKFHMVALTGDEADTYMNQIQGGTETVA